MPWWPLCIVRPPSKKEKTISAGVYLNQERSSKHLTESCLPAYSYQIGMSALMLLCHTRVKLQNCSLLGKMHIISMAWPIVDICQVHIIIIVVLSLSGGCKVSGLCDLFTPVWIDLDMKRPFSLFRETMDSTLHYHYHQTPNERIFFERIWFSLAAHVGLTPH